MQGTDNTQVDITIADAVGIVTLGRTDALNALSRSLIAELDDALLALDGNDEVHVLLLRSSARHFCAGADIQEMAGLSFEDAEQDGYVGCSKLLGSVSKPVVVAVNGLAAGGGCELVEMCDIVIAADNARFSHPEITLCAMPGAGGTQRLTRVVGKHVAMDMLLTARTLSATEALSAGLVSRIVAKDELHDAALEVAKAIAARPLGLLRRLKSAAKSCFPGLDEGLQAEAGLFRECFQDPQFVSALTDFVRNKRNC